MTARSADRARLLESLRQGAILYSTPEAPITHRSGEVAPWAFYSWGITLSSEGLRLAARGLLEALEGFGATQLASYGYTGLPLLSACVLEGGGRYTGLSVREQRKQYLTNRRVDGVLDRSRPVVVVDDSLSSGTSLSKTIQALEAEGLEVEGAVALVHFPGRGGKAWANAAGYRTATLFDIWRDLGMADPPVGYRGRHDIAAPMGEEILPEGLAPAVLARRAAESILRTGKVPRWPARLDQAYEGRGGCFVSFRRREDDHRLARDGFWHFDPADADPARDVVLATALTLQRSWGAVEPQALPGLKVGVTFFGPLEATPPAGLDFSRYGIVARSDVWPDKLGGALPNTQVFSSDVEQYRHARATNAGIADDEAHTLYRHTLSKHPEPGEAWPVYGTEEDAETAWWRDAALGARLARRARAWLAGDGAAGAALPADLIPCAIEGVAVTVYADGLVGYGLAYGADLERALAEAAHQARCDPRYGRGARDPERITLTVSVLHHGEALGAGRLLVERKLRRGLDAVTRFSAGPPVTVLPTALVYNGWSREQMVDAAEAMGAAGGPARDWRSHQVAAWVSQGGSARPLRFGFPARPSEPLDDDQARAQLALLAGYVRRAQGADGLPAYRLAPNGDCERAGTAGRVIHGLHSLFVAGRAEGQADWMQAARAGLSVAMAHTGAGGLALPQHIGGPLAEAVLLAAASEAGFAEAPACGALAARVAGLVHPSGWIGEGPKHLENPQDQDFLPGAAVWALAAHARATDGRLPEPLAAARRHYGRRFDEHPTWGGPWLAQGWGAAYALTGDAADADLVFRVADWLTERQLDANGAFLEDLSRDEPSFNTGFVAEGVAAAWRTALARRDRRRAARYEASWRRALGFVRTLTLQPGDAFAFPRPDLATGGVRCTLSRGDIRIDQVSHTLHALVEGCAAAGAARGRARAMAGA